MTFTEIMSSIEMLAETQGYYRFLLNKIKNFPEKTKVDFEKLMRSHKFKDIFEMCEYFENNQSLKAMAKTLGIER